MIVLGVGLGPRDPRVAEERGAAATDVSAYALELRADVKHDAYLREKHAGAGGPLGRQLLTAVNLLERVPSSLHYRSLQELLDASRRYELFEDEGGPRRVSLSLGVAATLTPGESLALTVGGGDPKLRRVEARLDALVLMRPPRLDTKER